VADSSKIGLRSQALICPTSSIHTLVTDSGIAREQLEAFTSRGIKVIVA